MKTWRRPYFDRVLSFFEGDVRKAHLWYVLPNLLFGNVTPEYLIEVGREWVVERMINDAERANALAGADRALGVVPEEKIK